MSASAGNQAESIAEALRAQILSGKYEPGERLPSERELSARLGVNRGSVREALKKLEQLGMITIRPGGGARVVPLEQAGLGALRHVAGAGAPSREIVSQWLDVQEIVLAGAARLAMERGTDEEFAQAKRLLHKMCAPGTSDADLVVLADQLTELIAIASRNMVLRMVRNGLTAVAQRRPDTRKRVLHSHRKQMLPLVRALERAIDTRDAQAAETGVRALLRSNRQAVIDLIAGPAN